VRNGVIDWFWRGRALREALRDHDGAAEAALQRVLWQRSVRIGVLPLLIAALVYAGFIASDRLERRHDLARGKPWRASSVFVPGCRSPAQHCAESPDFFFHTLGEASPWLEIDLGAQVPFSGVHIVNRADCCADRAAPLAVEVSSDRIAWREVTRRIEPFNAWKGRFQRARARWVRIRALRPTYLHLQEVRVLP
jgi:hypothetical protein